MFPYNNLKKSFLYFVIAMVLAAYQMTCDASSNKGEINILTWHSYLRSPEIASLIQNKCGVAISYDEYYSGTECLKRISAFGDSHGYDIVIFPNNIYKLIKGKIEMKNSNLNKMAKDYSNDVRSYYLSHNYPNNVVYFMLPLTGFVWNPSIINLTTSDPIHSMFKKAKNNTVILFDSRTGIWNLFDNKQKLHSDLLAEAFGKTIQDADIYIANGYNELYNSDRFAFSFQLSAAAASIIKNSRNKTLAFLIHPSYSYVTPDLLAELNTRSETRCVARILASKEVLDIVQKETYYLSPYGTYKSIKDPVFRNVYKALFDGEYKIRWIDSFYARNIKKYHELRNMWDKIYLLPQVMKNNPLVLRRELN